MSELDRLATRYSHHISVPWGSAKSDAERTIFVIYDRSKERLLRYRIQEYQLATEAAGKSWIQLDVTNEFSDWFSQHPYREEYFQYPSDLPGYEQGHLEEFENHLARKLMTVLQEHATPNHAVAVLGVGALFGFCRVSALMKRIAASVPGRLVIFFPGEKVDNSYRLLGARDGWDYLATAITAD